MNFDEKIILYYDNLEIPCKNIKIRTETFPLDFNNGAMRWVSGGTKVTLEFSHPYPSEPILEPKEEYWVKVGEKYFNRFILPLEGTYNSYHTYVNYFDSYHLTMHDPFIDKIKIPEQLCLK